MRVFMPCSHSSYVRNALITLSLIIVLLPNTVNAAAKPAAAANAGRTDSQIESDFRMRLGRSKLASDGIQVRVKGGVATLTGKTSVVQHKGSATRMAKSAGAHQVMNQIEISAAAREAAAAKMAANLHRAVTASSPAAAPGRPKPEAVVAAAPVTAAAASGPAPPPVRRAQIKH